LEKNREFKLKGFVVSQLLVPSSVPIDGLRLDAAQ